MPDLENCLEMGISPGANGSRIFKKGAMTAEVPEEVTSKGKASMFMRLGADRIDSEGLM